MKYKKLSDSNKINKAESKIDTGRMSFRSERNKDTVKSLRKVADKTQEQEFEDELNDFLIDDCSDVLDEIR